MQEIVEQYQKGRTIPSLARDFHKSKRQISKTLHEHGINTTNDQSIRSANTRRNKPIASLIVDRKINDNISKTEWAYIAGLEVMCASMHFSREVLRQERGFHFYVSRLRRSK